MRHLCHPNMCLRFDTLVTQSLSELAVKGSNDPHPSLRANFLMSFTNILVAIDTRALGDHSYTNYLLDKHKDQNRFDVHVPERR